MLYALEGYTTAGLSIFRLVRILRVVRLIGFLKKLNMLVYAFLEALKSVGWVMVLVVMLIYIFAVFATGIFGHVTPKMCNNSGRTDCVEHWFGTVPLSMVTLFSIMTDSWAEIALTMGEVHGSSYIFFVVLVAFFTIGMMNLLTAVFVEALLEQTKEYERGAKRMQMKERQETLGKLSKALEEFDTDNDGTIDRSELTELFDMLDQPEAQKLFAQISLPVDIIKTTMLREGAPRGTSTCTCTGLIHDL